MGLNTNWDPTVVGQTPIPSCAIILPAKLINPSGAHGAHGALGTLGPDPGRSVHQFWAGPGPGALQASRKDY